MHAVVIEETGGPEKLKYKEVKQPAPGSGEVLIKIAAAGVNYIDTYFRTGLYKIDLPAVLGSEGAGTVTALGPNVEDLAAGDRVAYANVRGSYAEYAVIPAWQAVKIPDDVDFPTAAGVMLQGLTAHYLTHSTFPLGAGDRCLIHAAAGGVGTLLVQMAKMRGAHVIATVGDEAKAKIVQDLGADDIIIYTRDDFVPQAKGTHVVYDSVGKDTFEKSLDCLQPRGLMVSFGNSSGPVPPVSPLVLSQKGSLFLTRPTLAHYTANREELEWRASDVFSWLSSGKLSFHLHKTYPFREAGQAHIDLQGRKTAGKLVLVPG
ncbi:MAG: quinone oxidoreductase [Acidobacteriia bacterium]|nr:quinone oxidoreductase [Terriglobia bacterium]